MQTLGEHIRAKRKALSISLRELSRRAGITAPYLSDVELGRRFPSVPMLRKIATILEVPEDELTGYDYREALSEFKRLLAIHPQLGSALQVAMLDLKQGKITLDELTNRLRDQSSSN